MLDTSTLYLIVAMAVFIGFAIILVHHHSNADLIRRKTSEADAYVEQVERKIEIVEKEIIDLNIRVEELDEEIESYSEAAQ